MPSTTDLDNLDENNQIVTRYVDLVQSQEGMIDEPLPFPICPMAVFEILQEFVTQQDLYSV